MIEDRPGRPIPEHGAEARERANYEEEGLFRPWDESMPYPASSMPAQIAGKCALTHGQAAFDRFHHAVFRAFFHDGRDISDRETLASIAADAGLDLERFRADLDDSAPREAEVLAEYEEACSEYGGWGVPLAIFDGRIPLGGAVPIQMYHRAVDVCLASNTGYEPVT